MEFIVPVRTRCGVKFHTNLDGYEMHAEMCWGTYDVCSKCLALSFISCHDIVHVEFVVPVLEECLTPTRTDSKSMAK